MSHGMPPSNSSPLRVGMRSLEIHPCHYHGALTILPTPKRPTLFIQAFEAKQTIMPPVILQRMANLAKLSKHSLSSRHLKMWGSDTELEFEELGSDAESFAGSEHEESLADAPTIDPTIPQFSPSTAYDQVPKTLALPPISPTPEFYDYQDNSVDYNTPVDYGYENTYDYGYEPSEPSLEQHLSQSKRRKRRKSLRRPNPRRRLSLGNASVGSNNSDMASIAAKTVKITPPRRRQGRRHSVGGRVQLGDTVSTCSLSSEDGSREQPATKPRRRVRRHSIAPSMPSIADNNE